MVRLVSAAAHLPRNTPKGAAEMPELARDEAPIVGLVRVLSVGVGGSRESAGALPRPTPHHLLGKLPSSA